MIGVELRDARSPRAGGIEPKEGDGAGHRGRRIRCPKCGWEPRASDRWACHCGHVWNTFETHALCPGCGFQWKITACLRCKQFSPHDDWYAEDPG